MSKIAEVLSNKNRTEKTQRARRREETLRLKNNNTYKASLYDEMRHIDALLNSREVESVIIKVTDEQMIRFSEAIYSEELSAYEIEQVPNEPDQFIIRQRLI